jgi:hypothetical protein
VTVWTDDMKRAAMADAQKVCDLTTRVAGLEAALRPFAQMAESYADERASLVVASKGGTIVSVYNLRDAAEILDSKPR